MHTPAKQTINQATKPISKNGSFFGGGGSAPFFQAKLTVNQPGDTHEREADAVADQVMRMKTGDAPIVQRMPLTPVSPFGGGEGEAVQRACAHCDQEKQKEEDVMRKENGGGDASAKAAPAIVSEVLSSGAGQPMDGGTRQFMESRFGQDFSQVRIHTDSRAAESASAIQARAYTSGRDMVFGSGEYQPSSESGQRLLAHELVHVGQQGAIVTAERSIQRDVEGHNADAEKDTDYGEIIMGDEDVEGATKDGLRHAEIIKREGIDNILDEIREALEFYSGGKSREAYLKLTRAAYEEYQKRIGDKEGIAETSNILEIREKIETLSQRQKELDDIRNEISVSDREALIPAIVEIREKISFL